MDAELVRRGLLDSRTAAQEAIAGGLITIDGAPAHKAATRVHASQALVLAAPARRFVSRGGDKLAHALHAFDVRVTGRCAIDVGMSTGGFTDALLQHGAADVVGYDVGYGQVHERLRTDERVHIVERCNIRGVTRAQVPPPPRDLIVADVSFIALTTVLPVLRELGTADAEAVVLVKPQFEAGRDEVGKGGVVRDRSVWHRVLCQVGDRAAGLGWGQIDATASPLRGPAGNLEFLLHLQVGPRVDIMAVADAAVAGCDVKGGPK